MSKIDQSWLSLCKQLMGRPEQGHTEVALTERELRILNVAFTSASIISGRGVIVANPQEVRRICQMVGLGELK